MNKIKIAQELLKIAKYLTAASSSYGWNNPDEPVQIFCDSLYKLADMLRNGDVKKITKQLERIQNYGKGLLLTKKLHHELISIIAEIEETLKDEEFNGTKIAKEIENLIKDIFKEYM